MPVPGTVQHRHRGTGAGSGCRVGDRGINCPAGGYHGYDDIRTDMGIVVLAPG